jgi:transcriptional regulator with XRE-family HTH domain
MPQLNPIDNRILYFIVILKQEGIIRFQQEFCDAIGTDKQNISSVRRGERRFTAEQIEKIIEVYHARPDWIFGYSHEVFLPKKATIRKSDLHPHQ